ncbi:phytoene desaturase family protein [Agilicoccus flavus]|uniref:phytoene desaturase family protein n=1 Tax=Agilicoccus flavus TaxID=2775968 RepID=UPI001CF69063|nr:NAD(P)/FAD-dependent oxidoreductase [Agilicoccus flavus]
MTAANTSPPDPPRRRAGSTPDVVVVGGGHNGLVAAAYLARAGQDVLLLERDDHLGGATVSADAFGGMGAHLSRYSYLVSLLPRRIVDDLGLDLTLRRRRWSSYTPVPGRDVGLLVDDGDPAATADSFARIGAAADLDGWHELYERVARLVAVLWPSMTEPLPRRRDVEARVGDLSVVADVLDRPLGHLIERHLRHDVTRGVVLTDGLIGTFADAHSADLAQNVCFLYHVMGGGTGHWDVPVGGMGAVTGALERAAREAGATLRVGASVRSLTGDGEVTWQEGDEEHVVRARHVLWAAAPAVLDEVMGVAPAPVEGAQVKVNVLLSALPRLREPGLAPEAAFGGTFHVHETYTGLEAAYAAGRAGLVAAPLPCEIYCHSITDDSILAPHLRGSGAHTLTAFALHTPHRRLANLGEADHAKERDLLERAVLDSISSVLAQPLDEVIARTPDGRACIETKTTRDLQDALAMPGGHIFHGPLSWPFAADDEPLVTPAQRWGVASAHGDVLLAGAGSRRGGGVSGLGGYHAARAILDGRP